MSRRSSTNYASGELGSSDSDSAKRAFCPQEELNKYNGSEIAPREPRMKVYPFEMRCTI